MKLTEKYQNKHATKSSHLIKKENFLSNNSNTQTSFTIINSNVDIKCKLQANINKNTVS